MEFGTFVDLVRMAGGCRDVEGNEMHGMQVIERVAKENDLNLERVIQFFQEYGLRCDCQVPCLVISNGMLRMAWLTMTMGRSIEIGLPSGLGQERTPTRRFDASSCEEGA